MKYLKAVLVVFLAMVCMSVFANGAQEEAVMAIVILSLLPVAAVYLAFQKYFIQGISLSGMKG